MPERALVRFWPPETVLKTSRLRTPLLSIFFSTRSVLGSRQQQVLCLERNPLRLYLSGQEL